MTKFTKSLDLSGHRPTILPSLVKSYDVKPRFAKQDKAKESTCYGIIEQNLMKICDEGDKVQTTAWSISACHGDTH